MSAPRFSIATVRVEEVTASAKAIHDVLTWIESRQNADGSWGSTSMLEKVIATCHCVMVLLSAGRPATDTNIHDGIQFLTRGDGAKSDWSFWRFAPLMNIDTYKDIVQGDLETLSRRIDLGAAPHPDQLLEASALKANLWIDTKILRANVDRYLGRLLLAWDENTGWRGRSDTTAHVLSFLNDYQFDNKEKILDKSLDILRKAAKRKVDSVRWGEGNVSTAYVLTSIAESWLWDDNELRSLAEKAASGLLLSRVGNYWHAEVPPYGGNEEIRSPDYFTAAICRGVIGVQVRRDDTFLLQLASLRCNSISTELSAAQNSLAKEVANINLLKIETDALKDKVSTLVKQGASLEKITVPWLWRHMTVRGWVAIFGVVGGAFLGGYNLRPIFDKNTQDAIKPPANTTPSPRVNEAQQPSASAGITPQGKSLEASREKDK